jgi:hypothetical protein
MAAGRPDLRVVPSDIHVPAYFPNNHGNGMNYAFLEDDVCWYPPGASQVEGGVPPAAGTLDIRSVLAACKQPFHAA